jgi:hypothetical protein
VPLGEAPDSVNRQSRPGDPEEVGKERGGDQKILTPCQRKAKAVEAEEEKPIKRKKGKHEPYRKPE